MKPFTSVISTSMRLFDRMPSQAQKASHTTNISVSQMEGFFR